MKVEIPESVKSDVPPNAWGKVLGMTPVVMAVVATMLAGLASSEMTRAQYSRSYAAQLQSKAGDQWGLYQAKKLRGAMQRSTLDVVQWGEAAVFDAQALRAALAAAPAKGDAAKAREDALMLLDTPAGANAVALLTAGKAPELPPADAPDQAVAEARAALDAPDAVLEPRLAKASDAAIAHALAAAKARAAAADATTKPFSQTLERLEALIGRVRSGVPASYASAFTPLAAARLRCVAARYDGEASLNQDIADLYELEVRRSNADADRHHRRSQQFFYGMLGAQLGVIIATFAVAARRRSFLWAIAAASGLVAVAFAGYVYVFV